jgi:hypothetical protein
MLPSRFEQKFFSAERCGFAVLAETLRLRRLM